MAKKVYTLGVDESNLNSSKKSTSASAAKTKAQSEVENFGIVEINNASSAKKVKNTNDVGFEKNVVETKKKAVKNSINKVDDYFDFSFRPEKKVAKAQAAKVEEVVKAKKSTSVYKVENETIAEDRKISENQAACERFDEEVLRVISIARMGSLFDCEKRMINL